MAAFQDLQQKQNISLFFLVIAGYSNETQITELNLNWSICRCYNITIKMTKYWLVLWGSGSVEGSTAGCYLVVLGEYRAVPVDTWWYWVRTGWHWLPVWFAFRKWFTWSKPSNYWNLKKEKVLTDKQMDRITDKISSWRLEKKKFRLCLWLLHQGKGNERS